MDLLLAIDIGTTTVKAGIFSVDGKCLGIAHQGYDLDTPAVDQVEIDAETYWKAIINVVRQALTNGNISNKKIAGIGVSSQGETLVAVDNSGMPVFPAIVWLDKRAQKQAQVLKPQLEKIVYAHTGIPEINPTWTACKIAWIKENHPEIYRKVYKFLLVQDFIVHRLTGRFVTDGSISCTTMLYDIASHCWWEDACRAIGLDPGMLADISNPGKIAGGLTDQAGEALGLLPGIPVILGGMDQAVGAVGAGNIVPEMVSETTGGALAIQVTLTNPDIDPTEQVPVYLHSVPDRFLFVPVCDTGGMALQWFRDVFNSAEVEQARREGKNVYDMLTEMAGEISAGCDGLIMLPHLMGAFSPEYNSQARGAFVGFTLYHGKPHFARAVLEAVAFMLRRNLELIQKSGIEIKEIRSTGGGAASQLWRQIKADVCQVPVVTLKNNDTALMGDAILAAVAVGLYSSPEEAVQHMVSTAEILSPIPGNGAIYEKVFQNYCQLNDILDPYFRS
ncbi:MAG: FGGY family carbohydrate kinase [Anaerolineales bacterium]|nr:FGGY family carbohydrate kinase [Anaerolineales bacterium]